MSHVGTCSEVTQEGVILARIRLKKSGLRNESANSSIRLEKVKKKGLLHESLCEQDDQ